MYYSMLHYLLHSVFEKVKVSGKARPRKYVLDGAMIRRSFELVFARHLGETQSLQALLLNTMLLMVAYVILATHPYPPAGSENALLRSTSQ